MSLKVTNPRVLVCQHGSRHRYAIPRILDEAGMLCALYTDSSADSNIGRCVKRVGPVAPVHWTSAARWKIAGIPPEKILSSDTSFFYELIQAMVGIRKKGLRLYHQRHRLLSRKMKKWGLQDAQIVYSMYHENLDFVRWAKDRGALSVVDVFISPITDEIMKQETALFPQWAEKTNEDEARFERDLWNQTAYLADLLICPSEWVAEGVLKISSEYADKIKVVPYGCSIDYHGKVNEPVQGRVLFAGRDPLRKGLHYLAEAATGLKKTIPGLDVRIAGGLPENVVRHPICRDLNFLGQLNGQRMREEFLTADVLVLPALSEGFAGVVAEAIGAGCPVIVTKEAGSPVINGREGLVVPSRNAGVLADAIQRMIQDRNFRSRCSANCLGQVSFYSEAEWMERLTKVLKECYDTMRGSPEC